MSQVAETPAAVSGLLTLLQLERRAREAQSIEALGFVMANETLGLVAYRQAAVWSDSGLGYVSAVSGLPQVDPNAPYLQWLTTLCRGLSKQHSAATPVDLGSAPQPAAPSWPDWLPAHALWLPLKSPDGRSEGALLLARDDPFSDAEQAILAELIHAYGHALAAFHPQQALAARLKSGLRPGKTRRRVLAVLLLLALIPMRLTVLAPAEITPRDPYLVRAPLDGVIEHFDVQPNQPVTLATPLFSLDTSALQTRRAVAQRAYDTATEEYRQSAQLAVTDDDSRLKMAQSKGELDQRALELAYTASELNRVQVKAERSGVAVFGDVNDWQGKAVTVGEKVLLLADPNKVELTAQMPVAEQISIQPGQIITFYPDANATHAYEARVISVAYTAAETDGGILAYRVRASFNTQDLPRLGLRGTARMSAGWAPFFYYALRRPLTLARQWLGV